MGWNIGILDVIRKGTAFAVQTSTGMSDRYEWKGGKEICDRGARRCIYKRQCDKPEHQIPDFITGGGLTGRADKGMFSNGKDKGPGPDTTLKLVLDRGGRGWFLRGW